MTDSKPTPSTALNLLRRAIGDALDARTLVARAAVEAAACGTSRDWQAYRDAQAADAAAVDAVDDALAAVAALLRRIEQQKASAQDEGGMA